MRVTVLLFAALREALGHPRLEVELGPDTTVRDLLDRLRVDHPRLVGARFAVAVNREYSAETRRLSDGDQIALIPPVSGG